MGLCWLDMFQYMHALGLITREATITLVFVFDYNKIATFIVLKQVHFP